MTRYILTPKNLNLEHYDVATLVPTDGFNGESIDVELPKDILSTFKVGNVYIDNVYIETVYIETVIMI